MATFTQRVGLRIRSYRMNRHMTQEQLAEKSDLHNTYIGQIERGEKNLSLVSLDKILTALSVSYAEFFEFIDLTGESDNSSPASQCYDLVSSKSGTVQKHLLQILTEIDILSRLSISS